MMTFIMVADCMPRDSENWFYGFGEGREFNAIDLDSAQAWLDDECDRAGTSGDEYFDAHGPVAVEV